MSDACPTCGQQPVPVLPRDHCISCDTELEDVFNNSSAKQYGGALEMKLMGGYGMFFDNIDGDHHVFLCCDCAEVACEALPWMARLLGRVAW